MDYSKVIIAPLISEKSMRDVQNGRFAFKIKKTANKLDVTKAVQNKFKVNVTNVSTVLVKGRGKRAGARRMEIKESSWKKAIVTLKKGEKIPLFDTGA